MLFLPFLQKDWGAWSPWGKMKRLQQQVFDLLQAEIEEKRSKIETTDNKGNDVLSLMMAVRDENGQSMTDEELKDEMITILFAGHETTATALSWAFYEIYQNPDVIEKLQSELNNLGENSNPLEIAKLPYLSAVCQETALLNLPKTA